MAACNKSLNVIWFDRQSLVEIFDRLRFRGFALCTQGLLCSAKQMISSPHNDKVAALI